MSTVSSTLLNVRWDSVQGQYQNGIIIAYEVLYEPQETFAKSGSTNTTDMSVVLSNLQEYVIYNVYVRAYTSAGPGPFSAEVTVQTLEDGNAPLTMNSSRTLIYT